MVFLHDSTSYVSTSMDTSSRTKVRSPVERLNLGAILDVTVPFLIGDGFSVAGIPDQFHGVGDDGLVRITIPCPSGIGDSVSKRFEATF